MDIEFELDDILQQMEREAFSIIDTIVPKMMNQGGNLLHNSYRKSIEQYYAYQTKMYDRHGEGVGTGTGWNLYNADKSYGFGDTIVLDISASGLVPYQNRSTSGVLEDVLETGGVPKRPQANVSITLSEAEGSFNTGSVTFSGTPGSVMDQALQHIEGRYMQYFKREWNKAITRSSSWLSKAKM